MSSEEATIRSIARRYRRRGYSVSTPTEPSELPSFLEGYVPDLLARNDRETVIVEVKRSDAVRGANELEFVADRIAKTEGWRFELVAIASQSSVPVPSLERMTLIAAKVRASMDVGLVDVAFTYAFGATSVLLTDLGRQNGLPVDRMSIGDIARELVTRGVLSRSTFQAFDKARLRWRDVTSAHSLAKDLSAADVQGVMAIADSLRNELALSQKAA